MLLLTLLLAGLYELPGLADQPAPDAARGARIEAAMTTIRTGAGDEVDRAVRELALCGEAALSALVRRLNEAEPGERLLLLAAASPMPRAAPLLEQAKKDPHPAVRAWAQGSPREPAPALKELAASYVEVLALAEWRLYDEAEEDLKEIGRRFGPLPPTFEKERHRMHDQRVANAVRDERQRAARRFAVAGAEALARGELEPDLADPVFLAYVGLLREEGDALTHATLALVALGERVAPALETLFERKNHDAEKIGRVLCAARADRGHGLFLGFARRRPDAQCVLIDLAPDILEPKELVTLLEQAALMNDEAVRARALDALLELPPPAGRDPARVLLDPERFGPNEFKRAAELLARCGDLGPLEEFATIPRMPDGESQRLGNLRAAVQTALRGARGDAVEAIGVRFLAAESKAVRTAGIDLVRDRDTLLAHARAETDRDLARATLLRLLRMHGADAADAVVELLHARGFPADAPVLQELVACDQVGLIVALAGSPVEATRHAALLALSRQPALDARFEAPLLRLHDNAPPALARLTLAALLPLGTEEVRRRFEAVPELALDVLSDRAYMASPCPFPFPLRRFLAGADPARLRVLASVAEVVPPTEPGLFHDLFRAWDQLDRAADAPAPEEGPEQEQAKVLDGLARFGEAESARLLFDGLVAGEIRDPYLVLGVLKAAARLLPPAELARLLPLLREQAQEERPRDGKEAPPWSNFRAAVLRGGCNALGYRQVTEALDDLCAFLLDPALQPAAFDWKSRGSFLPTWALDALRDFPAAQVEPAFRRALAHAEADGRLAACDPGDLFDRARYCRGASERGRALHEVAAALCDVLERMPVEEEVGLEHMLALGGLNRLEGAAATARADAARKRARGYTLLDGDWTPEWLEARASLYEALAARDPEAVLAAAGASGDPKVLYTATWYLRFMLGDPDRAARAGELAVRKTAGLDRWACDTLATVRAVQGRPEEALRLLDPHERTPAKRRVAGTWHDAFFAEAYLQLGEERRARHALEQAVTDRRVLAHVRADPAFAAYADVFRDADESFFFNKLFAREDD